MSVEAKPTDLLVVAAHAPDLRGLRRYLGEDLAGTIRGLHVRCKTVGVGLPASGAGTARRLMQLSPRAVVLVGTCGVYPGLDGWQPCHVAVADGFRLLDHGALGGSAAFSEPMLTELPAHSLLTAGLGAAGKRNHRVQMASPLAYTVDETRALSVPGQLGCWVENLEAFAVAHASHQAELPVSAVLGVSHVVAAHARQDWAQFQRDASAAAAEVLVTWIHNGAPGLPHG